MSQPAQLGFYPRAREGRDVGDFSHVIVALVSIRAPVKDATYRLFAANRNPNRFYPRAREGRDHRVARY